MKPKISHGATVWARQTIDSEIFFNKPDKWFKIWFYIVNFVNYKDTKLYKRGSDFMTYDDICFHTKATYGQVDKFIRWAKQNDMLSIRKSTRGMHVTVLNYNKYQSLKTYKVDTVVET